MCFDRLMPALQQLLHYAMWVTRVTHAWLLTHGSLVTQLSCCLMPWHPSGSHGEALSPAPAASTCAAGIYNAVYMGHSTVILQRTQKQSQPCLNQSGGPDLARYSGHKAAAVYGSPHIYRQQGT